jgi:signal transduction histidine kinase
MTMLPSIGKEPDRVAVFLTDLSSQKQAEAALVQSEKLAAVGRLASSISHEINNPLEAVTNLLYLMTKEEGLSSGMREHLSLAERELAQVSQIATQTLRFHRQATKPKEVTPKELIQPVIDLYHGRLLSSQIEIVYQHREARSFACYEGDLRQVLNNLVGNAIDSMRTGGRLVLRTRDCTFWRTGVKGVRITVADTGHGMGAEVRKRILEAFTPPRASTALASVFGFRKVLSRNMLAFWK